MSGTRWPDEVKGYELVDEIDTDVRLVRWLGVMYTMKILRGLRVYSEHEIEMLRAIGDHPRLPRLYHQFEEEGAIILILTYFEGACLYELLEMITDQQKIQILIQLYEILDYLHQKQISHRDIKAENLIFHLGTNQLALIDFGAAQSLEKNVFPHVRGTLTYWAPQYPIPLNYSSMNVNLLWEDCPLEVHLKADLFAAGLLMYELDTRCLFGCRPTDPIGPYSNEQLVQPDYQLPAHLNFSSIRTLPLIPLIQASTQYHPQPRPNPASILAQLRPLLSAS